MIIFLTVLVILLCVGFAVLCYLMRQAISDIDELESRMNAVEEKTAGTYAVKYLKSELDELSERIRKIEDEDLEEVLNKKWEDAIQIISNFDPFGENSK